MMTVSSIVSPSSADKSGGSFSLIGMAVTLLGGVLVAMSVGLVAYGISSILSFSIPMLLPAVAGGATGLAIHKLASTIGRCRNTVLAVMVAAFCATVAWGTGHAVDYFRFRAEAYDSILREYPEARPEQINYAIDTYLNEQTGQTGLVGFVLLEAASNSLELSHVLNGVALPPTTLSGGGLVVYWLVELAVAIGVAGYFNRGYSKERYCEKCHVPRKYKTPVTGTDAALEEAVYHFQNRNIPMAVSLVRQRPDGNLVRLEVEYCPKCYDSPLSKLIVIKDTGPKTWTETTVWADKLEPQHIRQIVTSAE